MWWWWALHGVAAAGIIGLPIWWPIRCLLLAALGGHWLRQAPKSSLILVRYPNGTWAAPELGRGALRLGAGSSYASWWIRLLLHDGQGTLTVLLLREQLRTRDWRALRAVLGRATGGPDRRLIRGLPAPASPRAAHTRLLDYVSV